MNRYYTTIEQSKKLLELGLDGYTADMAYCQDSDTCIPMPVANCAGSFPVPCWSVGALMEIMPQHIDREGRWMKFGIDKGWDGGIYQVYYETQHSYIQEKDKSIIGACYNMVIWLLENNYIKK